MISISLTASSYVVILSRPACEIADGQQIDLIVTDPPYNVAYEGGTEEARHE